MQSRHKGKALTQAQQAVRDYGTDAVNKPGAVTALAQIQAFFRRSRRAITSFPRLLQVPAGLTVPNFERDSLWDPLRKDPRFVKLVGDVR